MFICLSCIGDEPLNKIARKASSKIKCNYCGHSRKGLPIERLAQIVDEPLRSYCQIGEMQPSFHGESDSPHWEQEGESLNYFLQDEAGIDYAAAEDLISSLIELDPASLYDGDEPFFSDDNNYHRCVMPSWQFAESWLDFANRIKHKRRFFDDYARERLAEILGEPGSSKAAELPVFELGPGTVVESIFRARRADTDEEASKFLNNPPVELGPPPSTVSSAGRMNAAGITVFYGALSEEAAIAEVRPYVSSLVVVGKFIPTKVLRILDLSIIGIGFTGSIFHPNYESRATRLKFLEGFHALIARPIQPRDEQLEYIPTQAVAEYVSNVLKFDGILYGSAQLGAVPDADPEPCRYVRSFEMSKEELALHNIVLFGESAHIETTQDVNFPQVNDSEHILKYADGSANIVKILKINYKHERHYIVTDTDAHNWNNLHLDIFDINEL